MSQDKSAIENLLKIMAKLRSPEGCPWDREQDHKSLKFHAVEEVYELMDSIEAEDDVEMLEELGDLLLQVVFIANWLKNAVYLTLRMQHGGFQKN